MRGGGFVYFSNCIKGRVYLISIPSSRVEFCTGKDIQSSVITEYSLALTMYILVTAREYSVITGFFCFFARAGCYVRHVMYWQYFTYNTI